ncbi:netrin receptor UNC5B, partial [Trichinella spiralis]|uniref:netrin receptor UNC5B n=1 Tax=Trichinella spiralis TaxID=6334 RepID=UPI0001EFB3D1
MPLSVKYIANVQSLQSTTGSAHSYTNSMLCLFKLTISLHLFVHWAFAFVVVDVFVFWMKDGVEIESRKDPNVIVANDGSLLISSARFSDSGNYTCGARNIAHERTTLPATLHIYVDGQWSTWGSWEGVCPTNCKAWINNRRRVSRLTRYRHCNNPPPANGGSQCSGSSKEQVDCELPCPVDGSWSEWSRWTDCHTICIPVRLMLCDNLLPQDGEVYCLRFERFLRLCSNGLFMI